MFISFLLFEAYANGENWQRWKRCQISPDAIFASILHTNYFQQLNLFLNHKIVTLQQHIYLCAHVSGELFPLAAGGFDRRRRSHVDLFGDDLLAGAAAAAGGGGGGTVE